jgi:hypothetical protein
MKYREIARDIPSRLGEKEEKAETKWEKIWYWILLAVNIGSGPCKGLSDYMYRSIVWINGTMQPTTMQSVYFAVLYDIPGVCEFISGSILIGSVFIIQKFFRDRNEAALINTAALARHSSCFMIYLAATLFYFGAYTV